MLMPFLTNVLYTVHQWVSHSSGDEKVQESSDITETTNLDLADIVTSKQRKIRYSRNYDPEYFHTPVLDIDVPAMLVPSSTPGNHHLYIDVPMTWSQYKRLLNVMCEVGILEPGYVNASKERGFTAVRLPWIRKEINLCNTWAVKLVLLKVWPV